MNHHQFENHKQQDEEVLNLLVNYLAMSKTELVELIEEKVSASLGHQMRDAFKIVRSNQQIRSGEINLDRTHKSALVLIAFALERTGTLDNSNK